MSHKTLVGGTAYNITGGKSMVSGTAYNIVGGKTMVDGTVRNISFGGGEPTAMLYSDGNMVFQLGDAVESGKTLTASYTGFENITIYAPPWDGKQNTFKGVRFDAQVEPVSMYKWFNNARNMVANISNFSNLNMNNVTSMDYAYAICHNLAGSPVCGDKVTSMSHTYYLCGKLTGSPVCGNKVTNMVNSYAYCRGLTGFPVCGNKVTNMANAYYECSGLTGSPVCGANVTNMHLAYYNCRNLTGSPVCGNKVANMSRAYSDCTNLTGYIICGANVTNMECAYSRCYNLVNSSRNAYFYSSKITNVYMCFPLSLWSNRLNLYVPARSTTNRYVHANNVFNSIIGLDMTWTTNTTCSYNTEYNIYIYPVANVAAAAIANGDEEANANAGIV